MSKSPQAFLHTWPRFGRRREAWKLVRSCKLLPANQDVQAALAELGIEFGRNNYGLRSIKRHHARGDGTGFYVIRSCPQGTKITTRQGPSLHGWCMNILVEVPGHEPYWYQLVR